MVNDAKPRRGGRRKEFEERITLTISTAALAELDEVVKEGESRLDVVRTAVTKEVARRKRERGAES